MWYWSSHVQATSFGVESMFSWSFFKTVGILSSSVPWCCVWGSWLSQRFSSGASGRFLEALALYYRFCQTISPWVLPRLGGGVGNRRVVTSGNLLDCRGNSGKRVRLTRETRPGAFSLVHPDPGHSTPRRWKRLRLLPPKEWGEEWASLAIFFLALGGWVRFATEKASNLPSEGTSVRFFLLVSLVEGVSALALVRFN